MNQLVLAIFLVIASIIAFIVSTYLYDMIVKHFKLSSDILMKLIFLLTLYIVIKVFDKLINLIARGDNLSAITGLPLLVLFISLFFTFNMTTLKTVWISSTIVSSILIGILVFIGSAFSMGGGAVR
jgi:hypothetical protein